MAAYQTSNTSQISGNYSKNQLKLSSIAYLTTGVGLLLTFLVALVFNYIPSVNRDVFAGLASVGLIVSLIMTIIWQFRVQNSSMGFRVFVIVLYCISNGIGFGSLFQYIGANQIIASFALTAGICLACYIVSKILTRRAAMNLGKIIGVMFGIYFLFAIVMFFSWAFGIGGNMLYIGISVLMPIILLLAITYQMWMISKMDEFVQDTNQTIAFGMFLGFSLLMMIIQILWIILRYISFFVKN